MSSRPANRERFHHDEHGDVLPSRGPDCRRAGAAHARLSGVAGRGADTRYGDLARLCELLGYDGVFHSDEKWTRDVYVRQGFAAAVTDRIGLGISVTDPFTRHPALTAQATATLAEACQGRLIVIIGAGSHFETLPDSRRAARSPRSAKRSRSCAACGAASG